MKSSMFAVAPVFLIITLASLSSVVADEMAPPRPAADEANFGSKISRTMKDLATSTPQDRKVVRILFYGQSITAQEWSKAIGERLRREYPNADLTVENLAIGGFTAERLVKTAKSDLYPYYPDLVVFHVYGGDGGIFGGTGGEYEAIIANLRKYTTAEIILATHHVSHLGNPDAEKALDKTSQMIRDLAVKYDCELVDVQKEWKEYIADNTVNPQDLLKDTVHLSEKGCWLMEQLVWRHFRYDPSFAVPHADWISTQAVEPDAGGKIKVKFFGNRVDVVAGETSHPGRAKVFIDGLPPSSDPHAYSATRTSAASGVWWPAIYTVGVGNAPLIEDWSLKFSEMSPDGKRFKFHVYGTKTGEDGLGDSEKKFISNSGRVVVDPKDFTLAQAQEYTKAICPSDFEIKWSVVPMFKDVYTAPANTGAAAASEITLVKMIDTGWHTLEIVPNGDGEVPVKAIKSFAPPAP